jgi:hypothetical protein
MRCRSIALPLALLWLSACRGTPAPPANVVVTLSDDGGWCWYQDERALVHDGTLYVGTVAAGAHDSTRRGNIELIAHDLASGTQRISVLHPNLQLDDHDAPALLVRPDGRVLAVYAKHGNDRLMRYRVSEGPAATTGWRPEATAEQPGNRGVTYANLFHLSDENGGRGRVYNLYRGEGWDPNVVVSDDQGDTWRSGGRLLDGPDRPYLKYASNGRDTIHFVTTDGHPRVLDNSIYHGFLRGGVVHASDGTPLQDLAQGPLAPSAATRVFAGDPDNVAWTTDLELDREGRPFMAFSVQKNAAAFKDDERSPANGQDHRYWHARWIGSAWQVHEMAHAGTRLYPAESDYTGLVALVPGDPDRVFISTNADPATGAPLVSRADGRRHWEIFAGVTRNQGATWSWTPVTADSTADNLRPIVPAWPDGLILLWLRGTLSTYTDYDLDVVGIVGYRMDARAPAASR